MKVLQIQSKGLIEPQALNLIGATTKDEDETKIGMFGSGLKYAITYFMRNRIDFRVFSGLEEIVIGTETETFRGEKFEIITIGGQKTSMTTKMGEKDWTRPFMAIREIYTNAIDEGDATMKLLDGVELNENSTTFLIEATDGVAEIYHNYDKYFTFKRTPIDINWKGKVYNGVESGKSIIYFKGIRVGDIDGNFGYDFELDQVELNEVRELKYAMSTSSDLGRLSESVRDSNYINKYIAGLSDPSSAQNKICLEDWQMAHDTSEVLMAILKTNVFYSPATAIMMDLKVPKGAIPLTEKALGRFTKLYPKLEVAGVSTISGKTMVEKQLDKMQQKSFNNAIDVLLDSDYATRLKSKAKFCDFQDPGVMARADEENDTMWISRKAIDNYSTLKLASVIIEEQEHIITGYDDCTREFQTHLFELYTKLLLK